MLELTFFEAVSHKDKIHSFSDTLGVFLLLFISENHVGGDGLYLYSGIQVLYIINLHQH